MHDADGRDRSRHWAESSRKEQGLPVYVTDPTVLDAVRTIAGSSVIRALRPPHWRQSRLVESPSPSDVVDKDGLQDSSKDGPFPFQVK
jgi:hypothetical protein